MTPCDLAIVGGGIVGSAAAYLAARERPEWRVVLLERSLAGHGATLHSAGLDSGWGHSPAQAALAAESGALFCQMREEVPGLPFFDLPLFAVADAGRAGEVMERFTHAPARAGTADDLARLRRTHPDLALAPGQVLLAGGPATYGDAAGVAAGLVRRLRSAPGVEIREGTEVRGVEGGDGAFSLALADGRALGARRVLAATGPWALQGPGSEVMRPAGVRIKKVVALHLRGVPAEDDPAVLFFDDDAFLLPLRHRGHWLFSFASREWDVAPDPSSLAIGADDRALALSILERYAPSLVALCDGGRVFCDAYAPDRLPVIAALPSCERFVAAGACAGSGFRLAPAIARRALDLLPGFRAARA